MFSMHLFRHQQAYINMLRKHTDIPYVFLIGGFGCGKDLAEGTPVITPNGPKPIEDIRAGDTVCSWHGTNTVIDTVCVDKPELYRITFSDRTSVMAGIDHNWFVRDSWLNRCQKYKWRVKTTRELIDGFGSKRYTIPIASPVDYPEAELPIAPYTMGVLIGDGSLTGGSVMVTTMDNEIVQGITADGYMPQVQSYTSGRALNYRIKGISYTYDLPDEVKCVSYDKRIPNQYLYASIPQRLALLQGLMDTDGYVDLKKTPHNPDGCPVPQFCTTSHQLASDVIELVQSLGGTAWIVDARRGKCNGVECHMRYIVRIRIENEFETEICTVKRKRDRLFMHRRAHQFNQRYITSIEPVDSYGKKSYCLNTDGDHSFLCGNYIVTHNSASDVALCLYLIEEYMYHEEPINVGILGVTIKLLKQTVIAELEKALDRGGVPYKDNSQQGRLTVGNLTFIYLQMADPDDIYAHNFHCAIVDELDELPPEKVDPVIKAIQERCRKIIPAAKTCPQREPFIAFSTTAQGLGGTYQLIQKLQEQDVPYAVIRGRTQDNTSLAPSQLKLLRALYTEEEARAYLDGEFINLANGRVYPEFDRSRHMCTPFPIKPSDTLYVGADFNAGANASSVCVVRGNNIYVVATYRWHYVAEQAVKLRDMYPENKIILIPDASGKEIMYGFAEEFKDQDIEIYWNGTNPPVLERITAINKLFRTDRLKVFPKCKNLLLNLETRDFDENTGKPRKGGVKSYDHEGDSCEYAIWHILHTVKLWDNILDMLKARRHSTYKEVLEQW